jgi:hypothetical protein
MVARQHGVPARTVDIELAEQVDGRGRKITGIEFAFPLVAGFDQID